MNTISSYLVFLWNQASLLSFGFIFYGGGGIVGRDSQLMDFDEFYAWEEDQLTGNYNGLGVTPQKHKQ